METNANAKTGILLNANNIKIQRRYFKECVKLNGIYVIYRSPKPNKHWTTYAELETNYEPPILVGCLFEDHPTQKTMKKLGWVSELREDNSLIEVEYDLPGLQVGSLFIVPSGIDNAEGRLFRVVRMTNSMVYPCCITCEIAPEYEDTLPTIVSDFKHSDFNLLNHEDDSMFG